MVAPLTSLCGRHRQAYEKERREREKREQRQRSRGGGEQTQNNINMNINNAIITTGSGEVLERKESHGLQTTDQLLAEVAQLKEQLRQNNLVGVLKLARPRPPRRLARSPVTLTHQHTHSHRRRSL